MVTAAVRSGISRLEVANVNVRESRPGWRLWLRSGPERCPLPPDRAVPASGEARRAAPDDRHAAPAGRSVPCRAHGMPVAPRAAASGVSAVADDLRLLPGLSERRGLGDHPPPSGHDAA